MEEERSVPIPQSTGRRKSSSWKGFNLKRQLSKVDMKIKNSGKSLKEKRNSIFYSDASPNQDFDNVEEENSKSSPESEENTIIDNQARSPKENKNALDEYEGREEYSAEVQLMSDEEADSHFLVGSVGTQYEVTTNRKVSFTCRPDNLDLVDENGCPVRPPRHIKKKVPDKRDQRLLSVPNIKFQKPVLQAMCDLRDKEEKCETNQPTFAGNLMRRFSKF